MERNFQGRSIRMPDKSQWVRRVKLRIRELQRRSENRIIGGLSAACAALALSLIGAIGATTGGGRGGATELYGAMLLYDDAGGYVFAGVLAFMAGVVVTVLCIRHRRITEKQSEESDRKEKMKQDIH